MSRRTAIFDYMENMSMYDRPAATQEVQADKPVTRQTVGYIDLRRTAPQPNEPVLKTDSKTVVSDYPAEKCNYQDPTAVEVVNAAMQRRTELTADLHRKEGGMDGAIPRFSETFLFTNASSKNGPVSAGHHFFQLAMMACGRKNGLDITMGTDSDLVYNSPLGVVPIEVKPYALSDGYHGSLTDPNGLKRKSFHLGWDLRNKTPYTVMYTWFEKELLEQLYKIANQVLDDCNMRTDAMSEEEAAAADAREAQMLKQGELHPWMYSRLSTCYERMLKNHKERMEFSRFTKSVTKQKSWNDTQRWVGTHPPLAKQSDAEGGMTGFYHNMEKEVIPQRLCTISMAAVILCDPKVSQLPVKHVTDLCSSAYDVIDPGFGTSTVPYVLIDASNDSPKPGDKMKESERSLTVNAAKRDPTKMRSAFSGRITSSGCGVIPAKPEAERRKPPCYKNISQEGCLSRCIMAMAPEITSADPADIAHEKTLRQNYYEFLSGLLLLYDIHWTGADYSSTDPVLNAMGAYYKSLATPDYRALNAERSLLAQDWSKLEGRNPTDMKPWSFAKQYNRRAAMAKYCVGEWNQYRDTDESTVYGNSTRKITAKEYHQLLDKPVYIFPLGVTPSSPDSAVKTMPPLAQEQVDQLEEYDKIIANIYTIAKEAVSGSLKATQEHMDEETDVGRELRDGINSSRWSAANRENFAKGRKGTNNVVIPSSKCDQKLFNQGFMFTPTQCAKLSNACGHLKHMYTISPKTRKEYGGVSLDQLKEIFEEIDTEKWRTLNIKSANFNIHLAKCVAVLERSNAMRCCGAFLYGSNWMMLRTGSSGILTSSEASGTKTKYTQKEFYIEFIWGKHGISPEAKTPKGYLRMGPEIIYRVMEYEDLQRNSIISRPIKDLHCTAIMSDRDMAVGLEVYPGEASMQQTCVSGLCLYNAMQNNRISQDCADAMNYAFRGGTGVIALSKLCDQIQFDGKNCPWVPLMMAAAKVQQATMMPTQKDVTTIMTLNTLSGTDKEQSKFLNQFGNTEAFNKPAYNTISVVYPGHAI